MQRWIAATRRGTPGGPASRLNFCQFCVRLTMQEGARMEEHQVCEAARRLARAATQFRAVCAAADLPSPPPDALLLPVSDAMEAVAYAVEGIQLATQADLPTRAWLGDTGAHLRESASEVLDATLETEEATDSPAAALSAAAARSLERAADEFRDQAPGQLPDEQPLRMPGDADFAELLPILVDALDEVSTVLYRLGDACAADQDAGAHLTTAAAAIGEGTQRLMDAQDGLVDVLGAVSTGRAAEAAWAAGTEHGRTLRPAAITRDGDHFAVNGAAGVALAAALGAAGPGDVDAATAGAYCDAYAYATGLLDLAVVLTRSYAPGQQITTAIGRTGVLTGGTDRDGRPRVRFSEGQTAIVPREAILAPLAHVFRTLADAEHAPGVDDGDVLLVTSDKTAWVQVQGRPLPVCEQTSRRGRRQCEYEDSVRLAEEAMGLRSGSLYADAPTAIGTAALEFPAAVTARPPPGPKSRATRPPHRPGSPTRRGRPR